MSASGMRERLAEMSPRNILAHEPLYRLGFAAEHLGRVLYRCDAAPL
jgi:hypothetical protein